MASSEIRFRRSIPACVRNPGLVLESTSLKFRTDTPRFGRLLIKKCIGLLFNSSTYMMELYEAS